MEFKFNCNKELLAYKFDNLLGGDQLSNLTSWLASMYDTSRYTIKVVNPITDVELRLFNLHQAYKGLFGIVIIDNLNISTSFKVLTKHKISYLVLDNEHPTGLRVLDAQSMKDQYDWQELPKESVDSKPKKSIAELLQERIPHGLIITQQSIRQSGSTLGFWLDVKSSIANDHVIGPAVFEGCLSEYLGKSVVVSSITMDRHLPASIGKPSYIVGLHRHHYSVVFKYAN